MALDIFEHYATDEAAENAGTWVEVGGGAELLVARAGNRAYSKMLSKEFQQAEKVLEIGDEVADKKSDEIMVKVMANTILLGWKKLVWKKQPIDYSIENAKKLLAVKDFRRLVSKFSDDMSAFKVKEEVAQGEA